MLTTDLQDESWPARSSARGITLCYPAALLVALIFNPAHARIGSAPTEAAEATAGDIIVTAQRRSERLEDVPMSITAVGSKALNDANVVDIHDIQRVASGVSIGFGGPNSAPVIRGITTLASGPSIENNVAIYVDGFYEPNPLIINQDLVNLASIEILKGPQGTLYGRNATGGAILINVLAPSKTFTGKIESTYARFDDRRLSAYLSGPLTSWARFSLAGYYRRDDGYLKLVPKPATVPTAPVPSGDDAAPISQRSLRAKLDIDLANNLTATFGYTYGYSNDFRTLLFTPFAPGGKPPSDYSYYAYNYDTRSSTEVNQGTLKIVYKAPLGTLSSYTSYERSKSYNNYDFDGSYNDVVSAQGLFRQRTFQQAIDLSARPLSSVELTIGGLYYRDRLGTSAPIDVSNYFAARALSNRTVARIATQSVAVYVDATFHLTDQLSLVAGTRYNYEKKDGNIALYNSANVLSSSRPGQGDFHRQTSRASLRYEIAPRTNVYASWSQGFRPGTWNISVPPAGVPWALTKAETINAYEIGLKTAQRMLRFDVAAFYYNYRNLNVSVTIPNPNGTGVVAFLGNAPKAEIYGIDGQLRFSPTDKLTLSAGATWLHGRYRNFINATGTGINAAGTANVSNQTQDWSNQRMVRTPDFAGNFSAAYDVPVSFGMLNLSANGNYSSSYVPNNPSLYGPLAPAALRMRQRYTQPAYFLLGAQVGWTDPSGHISLSVFGTNLTDKAYRLTYNGGAFGDYGTMAPPRTYGVKGSYRF